MRLERETILRSFWVASLFLLQLGFLDAWEFSSDDGHTLLAAREFFTRPYWFGPYSSVGVPHPPFVYALWGLFLQVTGSLRGVQICVLLMQAAAHWLLIGAGRRLGSAAAGYLASALWLASPFFFVSYSRKFWEPAALPLFTMVSFRALLAFAERPGSGRMLLLSMFAALAAMGGHLNAIFLFPAPLLLALESWRQTAWKPWQLALLVAILAGAASPIFAWQTASSLAWGLGLAAPVIALAFVLRRPESLGSLLLLLLAMLAAYHAVHGGVGNPLSRLADLLSPFRRALPAFLGLPAGPDPAWAALPETALACLFLARTGRALGAVSRSRRLLFLSLSMPLIALCLEGILYREGPPHWALILFPLLWLAVADSALWLGELVPGSASRLVIPAVAAAALVFPAAQRSYSLHASVVAGGGKGDQLATLGTRLAVLDRVSAWPGIPNLHLVVIPYRPDWYKDIDAWRFLRSYYLDHSWREREGGGRFVYLHQESGITSEPDLVEILRAVPGVREERVGSITIFSFDHPVDGGGVAVR